MSTRLRSASLSGVLKAGTLGLLGALLFFLGSATRPATPAAYLSFLGLILLQGLEVVYPLLPVEDEYAARRLLAFRANIFLQLALASVLVAATEGSGSIYELVYLLPIVSAATKLPGRDVALVVGGANIAMIGFILTGEQLTAHITRVKEFQDAVAAMVYFTMAGVLAYVFAKDEREQLSRYQTMVAALAEANADLQRVQAELTERLAQLTQMEERLQRISQMAALGELAAQVAHEVRTPLGIIRGATEILASRVTDPSVQHHLTVLLEEAGRLNRAVESVLRLGAPLRIQSAPVNVQTLLRTVTQSATVRSFAGAYEVRMTVPAEPLWVLGDRELLYQALTNLVSNALQAMPNGGTLGLEAQPDCETGGVRLSVTDTGVGLSPEDLQRLGDPFFTKRAGGVGLGFSLARRIIAEHGGRLEVVSTLGRGTCITITLPGEAREAAVRSPTGAVERRG
ncbi:two-component system sensor histidine kinase NtrB [Nitrospira sp. Kam-Ns4a]